MTPEAPLAIRFCDPANLKILTFSPKCTLAIILLISYFVGTWEVLLQF